MEQIQDLFASTVRTIIEQELNEIQQEQFLIEGREAIISLFTEDALPKYDSEKDLLPDLGIAPRGLELQQAGITFLDVISGCYYLVKEIRAGQVSPDAGWSQILKKQGTNPLLVELLCNKYTLSLRKIALLP